ncbi:thioredoxin family protein [Sphingomonas sp. HITSZ_GF]|uniref:thioredoxin family protein n=1 Tax=Sphingomonas sp. HITSZ_GF TaxID=3037247 RepID=UPI00240D527F|nr:thioredoxin family protein [Sphingomonas sp. HITSZ_GF]MDG2534984.1 thioredoxin family protein [Sphingomonas sp. HITSZ_GF]
MIRRAGLALALAALAPPGAALAQQAAPRLKARSIAHLPLPLPAPYDASRDAGRDVTAALARAKKSGKLVLVDFGANWCVDCRVLAGIFELPDMAGWMARNFELVQVDIGQFDQNLDLPRRFGAATLDAVPAILVIDPRTGRLRNPKDVTGLGDARLMQPQQVADWLARWTR